MRLSGASTPLPARPLFARQLRRNLPADVLPPIIITHDSLWIYVTCEGHRVTDAPAHVQDLGCRLVPQTVRAHRALQPGAPGQGLYHVVDPVPAQPSPVPGGVVAPDEERTLPVPPH